MDGGVQLQQMSSSRIRQNGLFIMSDTSGTFLPQQSGRGTKHEQSGDIHKQESNRAKLPDPPVDYQNSLLKLTENDKMLIFDLQKRITEQRKQLGHRNQTIIAIKQNFEALTTLCRNQNNENNKLKRENAKLQQDYDNQISRMEALEKRNKELQSVYEIAEKAKLKAQKLQEHNDFLVLQNETFEKQLQRRMTDNNELEFNLRDEREAHVKSKAKLQDQTATAKNFKIQLKEAKNKIVVQKQDLQEIGDKFHELNEAHTQMSEAYDTTKTELKANKKMLAKLTDQYEKTKEELDEAKSELNLLNGELGDFKTTQENQNSLLQQRQSAEQQLQSEIFQLKKILRDKDKVFKETDAQQKEQIQELKKNSDQLNRDYQQLRETHEEFMRNKENAYFDLKEKIKKYENKLVELEDDRDHFRDQFVEQTERCREQIAKSRHTNFKKIKEVEKRLEEKLQEIIELRSVIAVKTQNLEFSMVRVKELEDKLQFLTKGIESGSSSVETLKDQPKRLIGQTGKNINDSKEVIALKTTIASLEYDLNKLHEAQKTRNEGLMERKLTAEEKELYSCRTQLDEKINQIQMVKGQKSACQEHQTELLNTVAKLNKQLELKEKELKKYREKEGGAHDATEVERLQKIIEEHQSDLEMMNKKRKMAEDSRVKLKARIELLFGDIQTSEEQIKELAKNLQANEETKAALKKRHQESEVEVKNLKQNITHLRSYVEELAVTCPISEEI